MKLTEHDIPRLVAFLELLQDVPDGRFRELILRASVIDVLEDSEKP